MSPETTPGAVRDTGPSAPSAVDPVCGMNVEPSSAASTAVHEGQSVHIGNCRSETKSALRLSPLRTPVLLAGAIVAFLVHVAAMHLPLAQAVLQTEPVSLSTWAALLTLALTVFVAIEIHKWTWPLRQRAAHRVTAAAEARI